jgi:hypothetical protein
VRGEHVVVEVVVEGLHEDLVVDVVRVVVEVVRAAEHHLARPARDTVPRVQQAELVVGVHAPQLDTGREQPLGHLDAEEVRIVTGQHPHPAAGIDDPHQLVGDREPVVGEPRVHQHHLRLGGDDDRGEPPDPEIRGLLRRAEHLRTQCW